MAVQIWLVVMVVLGIGLVIFVHESGHFLAARICKVRVEVFSLGFGPPLVTVRRGPTLYQVAAIPLGGFVKMAGDDHWYNPDRDPSPDSLAAKSVGQRFFIYSGGVLANVAFGLVVFPILFAIGVEFHEPMIGSPLPGGPAWQAGMQEGTRVLSVNGSSVYSFMHIPNDVALGPKDRCTLEVVEPGAEASRTVELVPEYSEAQGMYTIGVEPALDPDGSVDVLEGSPAAEAGVQAGDRLVAIEGNLQAPGLWARFARVVERQEPMRATFEREGQPTYTVEIAPRPADEPAYSRIGVTAPYNRLAAVRDTPRTRGLGLAPEDRVLSVDGAPVYDAGDLRDGLLAAAPGTAQLALRRGAEELQVSVALSGPDDVFGLLSDLAIRIDRESTLLQVTAGEPAWEAGMRSGDRVVLIDGKQIESYDDVTAASRAAASQGRGMTFALSRVDPQTGDSRALELDVAPEPWHPLEYGFGPRRASYVYRAGSPLTAIGVGMHSCWKFLQDTWLTLKGIVASRVSAKNLGGPIAIGVYAHSWASAGMTKFFFFLCILSINLAFINVLPVPVLDGGHLFFLIVEKIKGSPVSERVMSFSQLVGLVLIVSLFVFVIYNDVQRHIFG